MRIQKLTSEASLFMGHGAERRRLIHSSWCLCIQDATGGSSITSFSCSRR